ncbi:MAG: 3'(2'),5'-bisphosphate nucleotidase CysQ [Gammaproteobacteria bacterium]|nr:3'(2'),5'-bisphosphate nucleotidase CysQ [Gammaproteobacteria bacterium]MCI0591060.1 3'(2'),5'-bisphosphate nucleotidase CysQ [Gammaproteobacteria bacterium]
MSNLKGVHQNPQELCEPVKALAAEASLRIMEIYDTDFAVSHKEDRSPLTAADMAAHNAIAEGLSDLTPAIPLLSEESADIPFADRQRWSRYWLVDPLDGTREFIKRNGEFTVNIALVDNHSPVLGVVYVPVTGVCYYATTGAGAFKQRAGKQAVQIHVRAHPTGRVIVAGSRSHGNARQRAFVAKLGDAQFIAVGSALKSCLVAEGRVDISPRFGPTSEWDTAASQCVVEEAGGYVTDLDSNPLRYNMKESLLNPEFLVYGDNSRNWREYLP